ALPPGPEASAAIDLLQDAAGAELHTQLIVQLRILREANLHAVPAEAGPVPVAGPVVHIAGHVVAAVRADAFGVQRDRRGAAEVEIEVGHQSGRPVVAPGVAPAVGRAHV